MLLCLYPTDFRQQFAEEMLEIFRQKNQEFAAVRGPAFASFVVREFLGLPIGAAGEWIVRIMPKKQYFVFGIPFISDRFPKPTAEEARLSIPELEQRHDGIQARMLQATASHDFATARSYEAEVARLQLFLRRRNCPRKSRLSWSAR
jgi:hypothetical protein